MAMNQILQKDASAENVAKVVDWLKKKDVLVGFLRSIDGSALNEADKAALSQTAVKTYEPPRTAHAEIDDRALPAEMDRIERFITMITQPEVEQVTETVADPVTGV